MIHLQLQDLVIASFTTIISLYGSCHLFIEVVRTILPFGFIFVVLLVCAGYFLRVPAPSQELVETVIGKEPHLAVDGESYVMRTVAHRGAGLDAPENSLQGFKMCNELGCDAIEFDVTLTKDEVPICFHDDSLERMTGQNLVIRDHTWAELREIDISVKHLFRDRFTKTNIPTLEQTVTQLLASGQRMFIDIKDNNRKFIKIIHDLFERHPELYSRAVVTTFYPNLIYFRCMLGSALQLFTLLPSKVLSFGCGLDLTPKHLGYKQGTPERRKYRGKRVIRKGNPKIVCSMAWRPHCFAFESYSYPEGVGARRAKVWYKHYFLQLCDIMHKWALQRFTYYLVGLSVILLHKDVVNGKTVLDWRKRGVRVIAWTVNTPVEKQCLARVLKITYLTDTLTGEGTTHSAPL